MVISSVSLRKIFKIHSFGFKGTISMGNYIAIIQKTNKKKKCRFDILVSLKLAN